LLLFVRRYQLDMRICCGRHAEPPDTPKPSAAAVPVAVADPDIGDGAPVVMDRRPSQPNNFQKKKSNKRRSRKEMCKIRDNEFRELRRLSKVPSIGFIVEEGLLEDLCEISGEEAHDGGNIIL